MSDLERARERFTWRMFMIVGLVLGVIWPYWWLPVVALAVTLAAAAGAIWRYAVSGFPEQGDSDT